MLTLKKGDKVLAKYPGKGTKLRPAKVEQVATKGVDDAVQLKFIGDAHHFCIRWERIKLPKVTTNDPITRKIQPNTPSNPSQPKQQGVPATVVDLTADDDLEQANKTEEKIQELIDQQPPQSIWNGNKTNDVLQHPHSLNSEYHTQINFASSSAPYMEHNPWMNESSKEPVVDPYRLQDPNSNYNSHRDELPSTFRWRRNEFTTWRHSDYLRHEHPDEPPKFRWEPYEPQRPSESSLLPRENEHNHASNEFRERAYRYEYDSPTDPVTGYNDYRQTKTKEEGHRKHRLTGRAFEYLPKTDPEVYAPRTELRTSMPVNDHGFSSEPNHRYRDTSSHRDVLPDPYTNTTIQRRKDNHFEWNTVSHPPPPPLNSQVIGSESDTDTLSQSRDEQDGKKRPLRRHRSNRPVRKKSRAESELRKDTNEKQLGTSSSHIDLPGKPRHHSVDLGDIPIPRMGSVQEQIAPRRNTIQNKSEHPASTVKRFVEDEFMSDPYTSPDIGLQSGSPRNLGEERYPGDTILATGVSTAPLVSEQIPNGTDKQKRRPISPCDDLIATSFQPQRRFPFSAEVSDDSESDMILTEACQEHAEDNSLTALKNEIDKLSVSCIHTVKAKKRRKGIPKSMKKVKKVSKQLQDSPHSVAVLHATSDSKELTADWSYINSDKTDVKVMVFGCVCQEGGLRDYQQNSTNKSVQCGLCGLWSHLCCTKLSNEELASFRSHNSMKNTHFICAACVGNIIFEELDKISLSNNNTLRTIPFRLLVGYSETADEKDRERTGSERTNITSILDRFDETDISERAENVEALRTGVLTSSVGTELTACSRKFTRWNSKGSS